MIVAAGDAVESLIEFTLDSYRITKTINVLFTANGSFGFSEQCISRIHIMLGLACG
jgi:hypothetical protein